MNTGVPPSRFGRPRPAFTMVELIVVIVIIAILAGMVVPRMGNLGRRNAENEARAVLSMLSAMAQRDAMSSQSYAIAFDPESSRLGLLVLVENAPSSGSSAPAGASWAPAPLQTPVTLAASELRGATADGQDLSGAWTVEFRSGQPRPAISFLLAQRDGLSTDVAWQVDLAPGALTAGMVGLESAGQWSPSGVNVQDLDATGGREQSW